MFEREPDCSPETKLWQMVLLTAIEDAILGPTLTASRNQRLKLCRQARAYLTSPNDDLAEVCTLAGMDMQAVIEQMRKQIAQAPTPEELAIGRPSNKATFTMAPKPEPKPRPIPFKDRLFTIAGTTRTASEWCALNGIMLATAAARIGKGWQPEIAFALTAEEGRRQAIADTKRRISASFPRPSANCNQRQPSAGIQTYTHEGESLTLTEWSDRTGIKRGTLIKRLSIGWTFADAINTPTRPKSDVA